MAHHKYCLCACIWFNVYLFFKITGEICNQNLHREISACKEESECRSSSWCDAGIYIYIYNWETVLLIFFNIFRIKTHTTRQPNVILTYWLLLLLVDDGEQLCLVWEYRSHDRYQFWKKKTKVYFRSQTLKHECRPIFVVHYC